MTLRPGLAAWLLFPILGSALALLFRPSERQWRDFTRTPPPRASRSSLALPDGQAIRLIGIPDIGGGPAFWLGEREISATEFRAFDSTRPAERGSSSVSHAEALAFCEWLSGISGRIVRLPTREERHLAATGGVPGAEFAWGFGGQRVPRGVHFGLDAKPGTPGAAFGHGFRDLAGGMWEWLDDGSAAGGAWSERDIDTLRVDSSIHPPPNYRDADTGFRVLVESER